MKFTLSPDDLHEAERVALERRTRCKSSGYRDRNTDGAGLDLWLHRELHGVAAEFAMCTLLGAEWHALVDDVRKHPGMADGHVAGIDLDAKWTSTRPPILWLYPNSKPRVAYVLVTGRLPTLELRGWAFGRELCTADYEGVARDGGPAYHVPQHDLRPMHQLVDGLAERNKRHATL